MGFLKKKHVTLEHGWRRGVYGSFVEPLLSTHNVTVVTYAVVSRLLFETEGADGKAPLKVAGVEVRRFGRTLRYFSRRETILSSGAVGSPKILMLSGIGPAAHLREKDVPVRRDLPGVGSNLQDHAFSFVSCLSEDPSLTAFPFAPLDPSNHLSAVLRGEGPLTGIDSGGVAFLRTPAAPAGDPRPDVQMLSLTRDLNTDYGLGLKEAFNIDDAHYENYFGGGSSLSSHGMLLLPVILKPKSRGTVRLMSNRLEDPPHIDPAYLTHPDDVRFRNICITTLVFFCFLPNSIAFFKGLWWRAPRRCTDLPAPRPSGPRA